MQPLDPANYNASQFETFQGMINTDMKKKQVNNDDKTRSEEALNQHLLSINRL